MQTHFNIGMLASALMPVLFVLIFGYWAGRHHRFDPDQASGFSSLALDFALPAALFVAMTKINREQLFQQGTLLLMLLVSYCVLFGIVYWLARRSKSLGHQGAVIVALLVGFPAAPVYGVAVLKPLFGASSSIIVGLIALICNLTLIPAALAMLSGDPKSDASKTASPPRGDKKGPNLIVTTLKAPLVWAPLTGVLLVILGIHVPALADNSLDLLGVSSSGVAIFASGMVLAAHKITISKAMWLTSAARVLAAPALLLLLLLLFGGKGSTGGAALVATSLPPAVLAVLLASKYKVEESLAAATLFVTSIAMVVVLPLWIWISSALLK